MLGTMLGTATIWTLGRQPHSSVARTESRRWSQEWCWWSLESCYGKNNYIYNWLQLITIDYNWLQLITIDYNFCIRSYIYIYIIYKHGLPYDVGKPHELTNKGWSCKRRIFFFQPCWEWPIDSWKPMEPQIINCFYNYYYCFYHTMNHKYSVKLLFRNCFSFPRKRSVPMEVTLSARVWQPFLIDHQADFY